MPQSPTNHQPHLAGFARCLSLPGTCPGPVGTPVHAALLIEYQATDLTDIGEDLWQYPCSLSGNSLLTGADLGSVFDRLTCTSRDPISADASTGGSPRPGRSPPYARV